MNGYLRTTLYVNKKATHQLIHRLVAYTYIPRVAGKPNVNHKNAKRFDNSVDNLEWCTQKENMNSPETLNKFGRRVIQYKFNGKIKGEFRSITAAAKANNVNRRTLNEHINRGVNEKFIWEVLDPPCQKRYT